MELRGDAVVVATTDQVSAAVGDETVILELSEGVYFSVEEVAAAVWRAIASPVSIDAITAQIVAQYDVAPEPCEADVREFVRQLIDHRLARIVQGAEA